MKLSDEFFEKCKLVLLQHSMGVRFYGFKELPMPGWIMAICDDGSQSRMTTRISLDCLFLRIETNDVIFISDSCDEKALVNDIKKMYKRFLLLTKQVKQKKIELKLSEVECDFK